MGGRLLTRRSFLKAGAVGLAGATLLGRPTGNAYADESSNSVVFTPEIAEAMAERFIESVHPVNGVTPSRITPFYDQQERLLGYIVGFAKGGTPYGYVIFDMSVPALLSEFSLAEGNLGPGYIESMSARAGVAINEPTLIMKLDPLNYGAVGVNTGRGVDYFGSDVVVEKSSSRSSDLDPYLMTMDQMYWNYSVLTLGTTDQYAGWDEAVLREWHETGDYACSVAAGLAVTCNYGSGSAYIQNDLNSLWDYINPTLTAGGWSASLSQLTSGVRQFSAAHGVTVVGSVGTTAPSFSTLKSCIDTNNLAVLALAIGTANHAVTVQGYATIITSGSLLMEQQMVIVYDGWHGDPRVMYLNAPWSGINYALFNGIRPY